jgi:hypothetical protein
LGGARPLSHAALQPLLAARNLIQHRNRLVNLFQDGIFHHLGIDHLLQFELVQRKNAHHLHQARRQDLALRDFERSVLVAAAASMGLSFSRLDSMQV